MAKFTGKEQPTNPVVARYTWNGSNEWGFFTCYDKDKKEKIESGLLSEFVILRMWWSVAGWNDALKMGIWSNEVEYTTQPLKVKCGDTNIAEWLWKDIKPNVVAQGGHLQLVLTILMDGKIQGIMLKGSQVASVLDYLRKNSFQANTFQFTSFTEEQKGKVKYRVPVLKSVGEIDNVDECVENSEVVDSYFASREQVIATDETASEPDTFVDDLVAESSMPF